MAINRFMKPAEQPLMNTYVRLPFEQMSLAYAQVQKEHDAGEKLAGSLDDEILKVRASTPLHSSVLGSIRTKLDNDLSALYDKHNGRYADMVPELTALKTAIDRDMNDGNLYSIKETTRALEEDLNPAIAEARNTGNYSEIYNPIFGGERDWRDFYLQGYEFDVDKNEYVQQDNVTSGYTMKNGVPVLTPFTFSGIHKPSEQLKIANEQTFDKVKADFIKWTQENPNSGETVMKEERALTRSKIYQAALTDMNYYPDNMRMEIDAEIASMSDTERTGAAVHAINAIYGNPDPGTDAAIAKDKLLQQVTDNQDVAAGYAKADYIGYMGEKYVFGEEITSSVFDQSVFNQNKYPIEKSDWVPKIGDQSGFTAGTVRNVQGEPIADVDSYIDIVNNKSDVYKTLINEYETTKDNYSLDDPYHKEWADKINMAKYNYEASAMSLFNLTQEAAKQLNVQQTNEGVRWKDGSGNWKYVDRFLPNGNVNPKWETEGWSAIQFDESGNIERVEDINAQASTPNDNIYRYMDQAKGLFNNVHALGGSATSQLMKKVNQNVSNDEYFTGRSTSAATLTSTGSKRVDDQLANKLPGLLGDEEQIFLRSDGDEIGWAQLIDEGLITQETLDGFLDGKFNDNYVWLANPNPDGSYYGALTLPKGTNGQDGTIDLYFTAPTEVRRTWRNQGEYERMLNDGSGMTEMITRPRTEEEKQLWDANELAQIDFSRAATTPGPIAMSSAEDGENNPLGYYYFNQDPDGRPITNEQYVFQPRAGLIMDIDSNGDYIYTTGNELFNADTDASRVGMLITLNDPQYAGAKAFWANQASADPNPIAREGIPVTTSSEARGVDITGANFSTTLRPGQLMLPETRFTQTRAANANSQGFAYNKMMVGLNDRMAEVVGFTTKNYNDNWGSELSTKITNSMSNQTVTLADGSTVDFNTALNSGDLELVPVSNVNGNFSLPLVSGARSYEQQKGMYDNWVEQGKPYPPIANPEAGGFHVFGQAIDLSSDESLYDWVLVANNSDIVSIGGSSVGTHTTREGFDQTAGSVSGVRVSQLKKNDGSIVIPNYAKTALDKLFGELSSTPQALKDEMKREGPFKEASVLPDLKQFDQEWWHWSLGELTGASSGYVYPSWAN